MARIRSIHPGLFTDENYFVLSFPARELLKGLWVEADDNGIFEWKPLSLKVRIFPADTLDVAALLEELGAAWVKQFEVAGKLYGACKNFCQYQRPKKPKAVHPLPEALKSFVKHGYKPRSGELNDDEPPESGTGSPPVPNQFPTGTEKFGQMEDGGWKREDVVSEETNVSSAPTGAVIEFPAPEKPPWWPKRDRYGRVLGEVTDKLLFDVGKAVLGKSSGGQIVKLKKTSIYGRDWRAALELLLRADDTSDPPSWFAAALKKAEFDEPVIPLHEVYPEREYRA